MQEEERERKDQYVPDVSALEVGETGLDIDADTKVSFRFDGVIVIPARNAVS